MARVPSYKSSTTTRHILITLTLLHFEFPMLDTESLVALLALVLAGVALFVALAQLVSSYIFTKTSRSKVTAAAIGSWARLRRGPLTWSFIVWPFHRVRIQFVQPQLKIDDIVNNVEAHDERIRQMLKKRLPSGVKVAIGLSITESARGRDTKRREVHLYRDHREVNQSFRGPVKWANSQLNAFRDKLRWSQTKATWHNLMTDLVVDTSCLHPKPSEYVYIDADTIPSAQDAPTMYVHASDLVLCGFLLDMDLVSNNDSTTNPHASMSYSMVGDSCSINSNRIGTSIPTISYSSQPGYHHKIQSLTSSEARSLVSTARGYVRVGDTQLPWWDLGYNTLDSMFKDVSSIIDHRAWHLFTLSLMENRQKLLESDKHPMWNGKWLSPKTPFTPFLLAMCCNLAVANAFPRVLLETWPEKDRTAVSKAAYRIVEHTCKFAVSPPKLINRMMSRKRGDAPQRAALEHIRALVLSLDRPGQELNSKALRRDFAGLEKSMEDEDVRHQQVITSSAYKVKEDYGAELGGQTSWLSSSCAEFTYRISKFWTEKAPASMSVLQGTFLPVPILSQLEPHLRAGTLADWVKSYSNNPDRGPDWQIPAQSLLWLQIMLFDSWIGRHVEVIMGGGGNDRPVMTKPGNLKYMVRDLFHEFGTANDIIEMRERLERELSKHLETRPENVGYLTKATQPISDTKFAAPALPPPDEVCTPVDSSVAERYRSDFANDVPSTGWKRGRVEFAADYLLRLADGTTLGGETRSPSCMALTAEDSQDFCSRKGWTDMNSKKGTPEQWMILDAVLSLRAAVKAQRFLFMKDSSVVLGFRERDPVLQMI